eukprot:841084-Amphidinium_carterae.1
MGVKRFVASKDGGPKWEKVWKRDTYNLEDGKLIAKELIINMTRKDLTRPLPDEVKPHPCCAVVTLVGEVPAAWKSLPPSNRKRGHHPLAISVATHTRK